MAELGSGSHKTGDIARKLGKSTAALAPHRSALIKGGLIYSPEYGYATLTVPLFDEYIIWTLKRPI